MKFFHNSDVNYEDAPEIFKEQFVVSMPGERNTASEEKKINKQYINIFQY